MKSIEYFLDSVICDDCLEVIKGIPDSSIDLIVTDPPFGISKKSNFHTQKDRNGRTGINFGKWDKGNIIIKAMPQIERILRKNGSFLCFYDQMKINKLTSILNPRRCIYWKKTNPMPARQNPFPISAVECILYSTKGKTGTYNGTGEHNWFECYSPLPFERVHPTQKPEKLIKWLIKLFSNENDIILDPFIGSGTTAVACKKLNRRYIGIEISSKYFKIAEERIRNTIITKNEKFW